MANVTITDLTAATTPLAGTELVEIEQGGNSRKVTTADLIVNFSGAAVYLTTNDTLTTGAITEIDWDAEHFDVGGWWGAGSPKRLTVPSGVNYVAVSAHTSRDSHSGEAYIRIKHYSSVGANKGEWISDNDLGGPEFMDITTGAVAVAAGDYFTAAYYYTTAGSLLSGVTTSTRFAIHKLG